MEMRHPIQTDFSFHHSCHGLTMLHKLFVDVHRPLRHIFLKYILNKEIDKNPALYTVGLLNDDENFDIPFNQIREEVNSILPMNSEEYREFLLEHKEEMDSIPMVYPILGVPNGVEVEIHYKIRGTQCHTVIARQFSSEPIRTAFPIRDYSDYLIINAIGDRENNGIIQKVVSKKGDHFETFYDVNKVKASTNKHCMESACNLPNIEYNYEADFNVGLIEFINTSSERLMTPVDEETDKAIRYPGAAFDMETKGYLHAYSNESQNRSLLNMIMNGSGNVDWPPETFDRYMGIRSRIRSDKIIINIYASHCLSPQDVVEYGDIGNVIPFITDYTNEWSRLYLDEVADGADEEIEHHMERLDDIKETVKEKEEKHREINTSIQEYKTALKDLKKPLLEDEPLPKDWIEMGDTLDEKYYLNKKTGRKTTFRGEIPYISGKRKSIREEERRVSELMDWKNYHNLLEEGEGNMEVLKDDLEELEDEEETTKKKIKHSEKVRNTVFTLHNQDVEGELGTMLPRRTRGKSIKYGGGSKIKKKTRKKRKRTVKKKVIRKTKKRTVKKKVIRKTKKRK